MLLALASRARRQPARRRRRPRISSATRAPSPRRDPRRLRHAARVPDRVARPRSPPPLPSHRRRPANRSRSAPSATSASRGRSSTGWRRTAPAIRSRSSRRSSTATSASANLEGAADGPRRALAEGLQLPHAAALRVRPRGAGTSTSCRSRTTTRWTTAPSVWPTRSRRWTRRACSTSAPARTPRRRIRAVDRRPCAGCASRSSATC